MTTTETCEPSPGAADGGGDDLVVQHLVCCDDKVAMCGQDVSGAGWAVDGEGVPCPLCVTALEAGEPCGTPGCAGSPVTI